MSGSMEGEHKHPSPSTTPPAPKRTKGRQKIEMKRIENKNSLNVTFSKRHNGIFKKAEKLCKLFNTEMAILILSPAGRPHNWGYPSLKSVMDRYMPRTDEGAHEVQEEESLRINQNRDEPQNSPMGSETNSSEVVDGKAQILASKGTTMTHDFLNGFP